MWFEGLEECELLEGEADARAGPGSAAALGSVQVTGTARPRSASPRLFFSTVTCLYFADGPDYTTHFKNEVLPH